ncbi:MAG TPA: PIN domain-containing protein [Vicinamibacteria bacterium]|nr:PIN domain-containing protein [Vicinamibacteria bacterium]
MTGPVFVDTNVLVYTRDAAEAEKQARASAWMRHLWGSRRGRLSYQVLGEFYVTVTCKLKPGLAHEEARKDLRALMVWRPQTIDSEVLERAWILESRHSLSFWDALVVGAAQQSACAYLLTEDLQDGQSFDGLVVVNPFTHAPDSS